MKAILTVQVIFYFGTLPTISRQFSRQFLDTEHDDGLEFHTGDRMEEEHLYECESDEDMSSDGPDGLSS